MQSTSKNKIETASWSSKFKNQDIIKDFSPDNKVKDSSDEESMQKKEKSKSPKGFEKERTSSFVSKLNFYTKKFRFSEKELLMIKKQ